MTISYSSAIPNSPNDPADDVATMQSNAGAISQIIAIDHVGFNVTGGGQHNQVTFNANNVPTPPVSPPILFTNNKDGAGNNLPGSLPELFFYSGNTAQSKDQYDVTGSNGSVMLPMGIIIKWGSQSFTGSAGVTVTFAKPFPNNLFNIQVSLMNNNAAPANFRTTIRNGTTGVTGFIADVVAAGPSTFFWVALGN